MVRRPCPPQPFLCGGAYDPSGQDVPVGQGVGADDPSGQYDPAGHSTEDVGVAQKRPLGHASHDFLPAHDTYDPGKHAFGSHIATSPQLNPIGHSVILALFIPEQ